MDVDERILNLAEKARCEGKTLGALVEEALRSVLQPSSTQAVIDTEIPTEAGLNANDSFFHALDEIRAMGNFPATHRQICL